MPLVLTILAAIAVAIALVLASQFWFGRVQKRRHLERIGVEVLSAQHWRATLTQLVEALELQGYSTGSDLAGAQGAPLGERLLRRGSSTVLLVYKHGTAYRIGAPVLLDAEKRRQEAGIDEVMVVTLGTVEPEARTQADRMHITCLDGAAVWALLRAGLDASTRAGIEAEAEQCIQRPRRLSAIAASILAVGIVFWSADTAPPVVPASAPASAPGSAPGSAPATTTAAPATPAATATDAADAAIDAAPAVDPRVTVAKALAALPAVESATWSSASTLVLSISRRSTIDTAYADVCGLADDFPVLREARLQMEASDGAEVRWRRCP
ncbi:MAG TPA: hypothetical protein DCM32_08290 [Xanthomonadaceae bacterium]|jgi:hypothetical protein|nr:hypothetical protein [Xanthomonadaceae bacterium]